ncbi:HCP-like protein [Gymnopus androsaceus JB14]|uniref:HCP-like protein n=1 Tax=Gymnopus androsaceus JB14 TaxID=1447944 RepID=A0A6A4IHL7_9AGAR|nr:HCP-like protein [Gymnopus androsaceus JB14]
MAPRKKLCARKASWLAFGLVALAAVASYAQDSTIETDSLTQTDSESSPTHEGLAPESDDLASASTVFESQKEADQAVEASRAYKQALYTLSTLTAHPPAYTSDTTSHSLNAKSLLTAFVPSLQGRGPIGSIYRIISKIQQQFGSPKEDTASRRKTEDVNPKAIKVLDLLQHSAELGNMDALFTYAKISLFPPTSHFTADPHAAFKSFSAHAAMTGNATSQAYQAFFYSTGYRGVVPVNQALAQLYYTFAANGDNKGAQMALGYRYWSGIGTLEDCRRAVDWYEHAAEQSMAKFLSGPPGGRTLPQTPTRLSDLDGGIYGPGASVASTGMNAHRAAIKAGFSRASGETWEDILDYYLFNADRGETDFALRLGKIYYQGSIYASPGGVASGSEGVGAIPRNFAHARHYFEQIARQVWPRDPVNPLQHQVTAPSRDENLPFGEAAVSASYLGRMYLRGEGVKADPVMAKLWFERGELYGERECHNGLGIIWRDGLIPGVKADLKKAMFHFTAAANNDLAEAHINMAKLLLNTDIISATSHLEAAVRVGSPFEAYYYLGQIHASQLANPKVPSNLASSSCSMAVSFYKIVVERGSWDEDFLREAEVAWMRGTDESKDIAMLKWWLAAERGSEIAAEQPGIRFGSSILRWTRFSPMEPSNDTALLALTQWTRAAAQRNIDALVKVGDYYYHGLGVPDEEETIRYEKAAKYYQSAADTQMSALALWNLGWMYENGVGVPQDFHLAKRHYDLAAQTNSEAYLPVFLSLAKLYVRSIWHTLCGGQDGLNIWYDDEEMEYQDESMYSDGAHEPAVETVSDKPSSPEEQIFYEDEGPWYMDEEEDPIQWARNRRNAEERESEYGSEDYLETGLRGGEEDDDEYSETMLLIILCVTVSVLIYVRTRIVRRMRHDQQQQQQQQGPAINGGMFPPPGDPARNDWAVLR